MALNASNIISNEGLIRRVDLILPEKQDIADGKALKQNYIESSVEWVTSHPNLQLESHFNLAASGICGNTALLDFGDMSYLGLPLSEMKMYNFEQFLKNIGRDNKDSFIFGNGIYRSPRPRGHILRELVLNTSFPPSTNEEIESRNKSRVIHFDIDGKCNPRKLNLHELECTGQGTYFLCDGSTTNASVLRVYAEGPLLPDLVFSGGEGFIYLMQKALEERFGSNHFVALGGVYAVNTINDSFWKHRLYRNNWENQRNIFYRYCKVNEPQIIVATFNSSTELLQINPGPPIKLNSSKSIHSLSHHSASVNFPVFCGNWVNEYVGYFCPATTLYRFDESL